MTKIPSVRQKLAALRSKEVRMRVIPQNNMADSEQDDLSDDEDILLFLLLIRRRRRRLRAANRQLWAKRWILRRRRVYDNLIQELN